MNDASRVPSSSPAPVRVVVVGAGASGLMTALVAARVAAQRNQPVEVVLLEGKPRVGAKILVSGGGRCNVTNVEVRARDFQGGSRKAIDRVLRRFPAKAAREFFQDLGVALYQEQFGKLFPVSDSAREVLEALLAGCREAGVALRTGARVDQVRLEGEGSDRSFRLDLVGGEVLRADRVVLATGGRSLPKSGSDGAGFRMAESLGHGLTSRILPALVPLLLEADHPLRELSGIAVPVQLWVESGQGKKLEGSEGALLLTHKGVSGPAVLDISRSFLSAREDDPEARLRVQWLPEESEEELDRRLQALPSRSILPELSGSLPRRLLETLWRLGDLPEPSAEVLDRGSRRRLVESLLRFLLPVTGAVGWHVAETTAGGIPLDQIHLKTMESRRVPGLYLVGELLDVDGRIGGFNFHWAWASGWVAGQALGAGNPGGS